MKLFIITVTDDKQQDAEFCQFNESLATIATIASNMKFRVRAIEEIPQGTTPLPFPTFHQMAIGEAEKYRIHGPHDADVFPEGK